MDKNVAISVLNVSDIYLFLKNLKEVISKIEVLKIKSNILDVIVHVDIMDGNFVNNTGVDLKCIKIARDFGFYTDTHLMVKKPVVDKYIEKAIAYGTNEITIHYEIENFEETLNYLNKKREKIIKESNKELVIGVAIKPNTSVKELVKYEDLFSKILVMTVEPGYGGQKYIDSMNEKIILAKKLFPNHSIQIDGGVNLDTLDIPLREGVGSFVIGSYLTNSTTDELYNKLICLSIKNEIENLPKKIDLEFEKRTLQIVPSGYGENDTLIGVNVPDTRKLANKWYKYINYDILDNFISSNYHEYRRFAIFCLSNIIKISIKNNNFKEIERVNQYIENNMLYINNWDLTDEVAPNITGRYLENLSYDKRKEKIDEYIYSDNLWKKRIGIVSELVFARKGAEDTVFYVLDKVIYEKFHLFQKASGWVLRELYKKKPNVVLEYLKDKNRKENLPSILLTYACEKMTSEEKEYVKGKR